MAVRIRIQLDAEAGKLADTVQKAVAKGFQGAGQTGLATSPQSTINQIMGSNADKFDNRMWRYRGVYRNIITPPIPDFPSSFFTKGEAQRAQFLKNFGFIGAPLLAPTSILGNMFAARQLFTAFHGDYGQGLIGKVGLSGIGGAAIATGGTMAAALTLGIALKGLERVVREITSAFENAKSLYTKATLGGGGVRFEQFKSSIAGVLGVNENEIFQFGAAMAYLTPKLKWANDTIAQNNREVATAAVNFGIMKEHLKAMGTSIAVDLLPAILKFTHFIESLAHKVSDIAQSNRDNQNASQAFGEFLKKYNIQGTRDTKSGAVKFFLGDYGKQDMGVTGPRVGASTQKRLESLWHDFLSHMSKSKDLLPNPQAFMKQLPVSAFERMGLVIKGFGPGNDYARRTAVATEKTAKLLNGIYSGGGVPRAFQFFNPVANSP